jgi:hypothetical protein
MNIKIVYLNRMDTRFWGPSGWRLLHLIAVAAPQLPQTHLRAFFSHLPYVLPCKFCRASLTDYIAADPIPIKAADYAHWLYRIHNRVNAKLREQKLLEAKDPSWATIRARYTNYIKASCVAKRMIGWDFLYSVAYTTPCAAVETAPIPGAPPRDALTTPALRNRWAVISRAERLPFMTAWWDALPHVLPFKQWRDAWDKSAPIRPSLAEGRDAMTEWLFETERAVCTTLREDAPHDDFKGLCAELSTFASGCGKRTRRAKTCRAVKGRARSTLRHRRTRVYKAVGGFL